MLFRKKAIKKKEQLSPTKTQSIWGSGLHCSCYFLTSSLSSNSHCRCTKCSFFQKIQINYDHLSSPEGMKYFLFNWWTPSHFKPCYLLAGESLDAPKCLDIILAVAQKWWNVIFQISEEKRFKEKFPNAWTVDLTSSSQRLDRFGKSTL